MSSEWMIAGGALAYVLAALVVLWLFAKATPDRVALPALAASSVLYLSLSLLQWLQLNTVFGRDFFLGMSDRTSSRYSMASEGFRNGAYGAATTVATICMLILIWDRWLEQKAYRSAAGIFCIASSALLVLNYLVPLAAPFFKTEAQSLSEFILIVADVSFFIWAFVMIARSEVMQRFFSRVPESKK